MKSRKERSFASHCATSDWITLLSRRFLRARGGILSRANSMKASIVPRNVQGQVHDVAGVSRFAIRPIHGRAR
jgi:hypothetical protein